MTTYPHRIHAHRPHVNWPLVAIVGLAAALIGLGSWVLVDRYAGGGGATQDATTLIDDINTAYATGDANAMPSLYTSNAVLRSLGQTYSGMSAIRTLANGNFKPERVAPVTLHGEFATTYVKLSVGGVEATTTLSVFEMKNGKVMRQWNFAAGSTPPFDNALVSSF